MAADYDWHRMSEPTKIETLSLWIRENTPPTGIAFLCDTAVEVVDEFVAKKLPHLKNIYESCRISQKRMESLLDGDDYPPFNLKKRYG